MVRQVSLCIGLALALAPAAFAQGRGPGARGGDNPLEERVKKLEAELKELKAQKPAEVPAKPSAEEIAKARKQVEELGAAMKATAEKFHAAVKKLAEMEGKPVPAVDGMGHAPAGFPGGPMMGGGGPGGPMAGFGGFGGGTGGFGRSPERGREGGRPMAITPLPAPADHPADPEIVRLKKEMAEMKAMLMEMRDSMRRNRKD